MAAPRTPQYAQQRQQGFTLVELVMVITILGVIGSVVAVFMKGPIDAYFASARRAALTDVADTTVRRIARDLRNVLPNTARVSGSSCLEFIPTKLGARYRAEGSGALVFGSAVTSFNMLGDHTLFAGSSTPADQRIAVGDLIVVYNLGIPGADAYAGDNYSAVTAVGAASASETPISIGSKTFSLQSASRRFHVVPAAEAMVSYVCSGSSLYRTASATPTASASCPTSGSRIATNVDCGGTSFVITDAGNALNRNALVSMRLSIQDSTGTESVTVQHEVHMDNTP